MKVSIATLALVAQADDRKVKYIYYDSIEPQIT